MKTKLRTITLFMLLAMIMGASNAQIIITSDNMPGQGDTIRVSQASVPVFEMQNPELTGYDYTWDYSSLRPDSQEVLQFVSPTQTPILYQFTFTPAVANLATPIEGFDFVDLQVTDAYAFYKNSSSEFVRAGYAATVMGLPLPMKYSQPEKIYTFPLSASSLPDSSLSEITVQYPSVAYFNQTRKRVNIVDGSGTLITPFGTFNTLRVKSVIYERDSLFLDSLQTGVPIIRNIIEYQWLNPDFIVPVLTITQEDGFSNTIQYPDSVRNIVPLVVELGDDIDICNGESVTLTAQVSGGEPPYSFLWSTFDTTQSITVMPDLSTEYSVLVMDNTGNITSDAVYVNVIPLDLIELGNDTIVCAGHNLNFLISENYDQISWFIDNELAASGQSFTIDTTGIGMKTITLGVEFRQGDCTGNDEVQITFQLCESIDEHGVGQISLSPNPANEALMIESILPFINPKVSLKSLLGSESINCPYSISQNRLTLSTKELKKGIYILVIHDEATVYTGKFIKQ